MCVCVWYSFMNYPKTNKRSDTRSYVEWPGACDCFWQARRRWMAHNNTDIYTALKTEWEDIKCWTTIRPSIHLLNNNPMCRMDMDLCACFIGRSGTSMGRRLTEDRTWTHALAGMTFYSGYDEIGMHCCSSDSWSSNNNSRPQAI